MLTGKAILYFSIGSGYPVLTGGWMVQEVELLQSWGLSEAHIASAVIGLGLGIRSNLEMKYIFVPQMFNAGRASFLDDTNKKHLMRDLRKSYGLEDKVELEIFINHKCGLPDDPRRILKTSF